MCTTHMNHIVTSKSAELPAEISGRAESGRVTQ